MTGRRILAVVIAASLIVGAWAVRRLVIDGDTADGGESASAPRLACSAELAATCRELETESGVTVEIAPAGEIAATLTNAPDGEVPWDGWLAVAPWPDGVRDARLRAGQTALLGKSSRPIARSPLVIALRDDRAEVLESTCGAAGVSWRCIGEYAGQPWSDLGGAPEWGTFRPAHAEPLQDGIGRLVVGQAAGHFLATPEVGVSDIARIDWEGNDGFGAWFDRLENSIPSDLLTAGSVSPFRRWLQTRLLAADAVAGTEAEIVTGLTAADRALAGSTRVVYPRSLATADVVFVPVGPRGDELAEIATGSVARASLASNGWRVPGQARAAGIPATPGLPRTNGLASAGVLEALAGLWGKVVR